MLTAEASAQTLNFAWRKRKVPFSMAMGNGKLMHECFPKHPRMGTARRNKTKKQKKVIREA